MSYLLDTNTVSELIKPDAAPQVAAWVDHLDERQLFLSVLTFAEVRRGIELMEAGRRRNRLRTWLEDDLPDRFAGRIIEIDRRVAEAWGAGTTPSARSSHADRGRRTRPPGARGARRLRGRRGDRVAGGLRRRGHRGGTPEAAPEAMPEA